MPVQFRQQADAPRTAKALAGHLCLIDIVATAIDQRADAVLSDTLHHRSARIRVISRHIPQEPGAEERGALAQVPALIAVVTRQVGPQIDTENARAGPGRLAPTNPVITGQINDHGNAANIRGV